MAAPQVRTLPTAPSRRDDPDLFVQRADAFLGALDLWGQDINTVTSWVIDEEQVILSYVADASDEVTLANQWATLQGDTVDGSEWSAKEYASGSEPTTGSAKEWATSLGIQVNGDFSAKEWAIGNTALSAKKWALSETDVEFGSKGAYGYAQEAAQYANLAQATSSFKGQWSTLTGSLDVPSTVFHNGDFWTLLVDVDDVALSEPSASNTDWQLVDLRIETRQTPIGTPEWPVSFDYNVDGTINFVLYTYLGERYKQTLTYTTDGLIDTVVYEFSNDSGATYTIIGTETYVYSNGILQNTTWAGV